MLAEDALGGPAALRRTPMQAAAGTAIQLINVPVNWLVRSLDRAVDTVRATPMALSELISRGKRVGDVASKTVSASRDAALETAEEVIRDGGAERSPTCCTRPGAPPVSWTPTSCRSTGTTS